MNETKYTPGPWSNTPMQDTIWANDGDTKVATVADLPWIENSITGRRSSNAAQEEANAQLIAAAPELLAACQNGLRAMRALGWDQSPTESQYFKDYAATASAIYKATKHGIQTPAISENLNQTL